ncbi:DUF2398 family protein [Desertimonas flava]|uniref:DUF2398 family protein n=1 Tax=Desertimonas flava TaxID=2064846 RepID=UPI000E34D219|nr:DUF2398 family protein [Desertimonas flava]
MTVDTSSGDHVIARDERSASPRGEQDPQGDIERRAAARHLLGNPLTCEEHDPDIFRWIRRHEAELGRWFTQRLGYRLHLDADTARLYKTGVVLERRPLRTATGRPLNSLEHTLVALTLAATAAGPSIVSLRDLVAQVRSAAVEADVALPGDAIEQRAHVVAIKWMIDHGLAAELHEHVDAYATDETADAVLRVRPDRIALLLVPGTAGSADLDELLRRSERRSATRSWMRARLVEEPVLYRTDVTDQEWGELRRRLGEEERSLQEMFDLALEARAEGVAMIDGANALSDLPFPTTGTLGHAALLTIERLGAIARESETTDDAVPRAWFDAVIADLVAERESRWRNDYVERPEKLSRHVLTLLVDLRLAEAGVDDVRLLPAAARFLAVDKDGAPPVPQQAELF